MGGGKATNTLALIEATPTDITVTFELKLAREFLDSLPDQRLPWAHLFEVWSAERGLSADLTRNVKLTILRLRTFHAIERHAGRRP